MGARVSGDGTAVCVCVPSVRLCPDSELFKNERETVTPGEDTGRGGGGVLPSVSDFCPATG